MMRAIAMLLFSLAACQGAGTEGPATPPPVPGRGTCNHEGLDRFVGQKVSTELGAELLNASGARTLRWGGPGMAMTMDYREDRLTVSYGETMAITSARCG